MDNLPAIQSFRAEWSETVLAHHLIKWHSVEAV